MSIKGMTDHAPMFPTIGTLRKGEKKVSDNKPGKDLTYLRFESDDPLAVRMFNEAYPDEDSLRNIHCFLPNKTADENMESWIEEWVAGGLVHRCDGETKVLWRTKQGGYSTEPKPCQNCKGKQVGRLTVIVPELGRLACVTVLTTSIHDIINLTRQLRSYEALRGDLRGIPFILRRRKDKISTPGPEGKRVRREKWLLSIETQPEWTMLQLSAMQQAALPSGLPESYEEGHYEESGVVINPFDESIEVDTETGEVIEGPEPEPANGNGHTRKPILRPFSPETLRDALRIKVEKSTLRDPETQEYLPIELHEFGSKTAQIVASRFQAALGSANHPEEAYKVALRWLIGKENVKDLTAAEADTVLDWLVGKEHKAEKFKAQVVEFSAAEALAVFDQAMSEPVELTEETQALEVESQAKNEIPF